MNKKTRFVLSLIVGFAALLSAPIGKIDASNSYQMKNDKTIKHVSFTTDWTSEKQTTTTNAVKLGFPKDKKIILFHMDDLGMCDEANQSGEFYMKNGFVNSGAVMMPCPHANAFVEWAKNNPKKDVGAHLTLTSEWKTYRWVPLTPAAKVPGLIDPDGKFWHEVAQVVEHASAAEVETEIRAQIDRMIALGLRPSHLDTHMGTLYGSPEYVKVFLKVAEEYGIPANAIDLSNKKVADLFRSQGYPITDGVVDLLNSYSMPKLDFFTSVPHGKTYEEKRDNFFELLKSLPNALTEIIFHPSVETENLKTITGSWQQRVWEAQLFSDPVVIQFFKDNNIVITDWKEIISIFKSNF